MKSPRPPRAAQALVAAVTALALAGCATDITTLRTRPAKVDLVSSLAPEAARECAYRAFAKALGPPSAVEIGGAWELARQDGDYGVAATSLVIVRPEANGVRFIAYSSLPMRGPMAGLARGLEACRAP